MATPEWPSFLRTLQDLGYADVPIRRRDVDLGPIDLQKAIRKESVQLTRLFAKHDVLRRLGELCRRYQAKWRRAGVLAPFDAHGLHELFDSLVRRHLVLRSDDGGLEVHPAVRDHFKQLATNDLPGRHDAIREQLLSLAHRPGMRLPEDPRTLDLIEEAIYHALEAGRHDEALSLYECRFVWGALAAQHLLGDASLRQRQFTEAVTVLPEAHAEASHFGHPRADAVHKLLESVPSRRAGA